MKQNSAHTQKKTKFSRSETETDYDRVNQRNSIEFCNRIHNISLLLDSCIYFNKRDGTSLTIFMGES